MINYSYNNNSINNNKIEISMVIKYKWLTYFTLKLKVSFNLIFIKVQKNKKRIL